MSLREFPADIRFGLRRLAKRPGFAAVVVLTLALGIGGNTAVFSGVHYALLQMIESSSPRELVWIVLTEEGDDGPRYSSLDFYEQLRSIDGPFRGFCALGRFPSNVRVGATTQQLLVETGTSEYFPLLGVNATFGRVFGESDRDAAVAVLEYGFWQEQFGSDPGAIGKTIDVTGQPFTIIGVAPEGFRGLEKDSRPSLWIPMEQTPLVMPGADERWRTFMRLKVFARLPRDADIASAQSTADLALSRHVEYQVGQWNNPGLDSMRQWRARLRPAAYGDDPIFPAKRKQVKETVTLLGAVVALILLLVCANVANLMLGDASRRRQEIAMRLALGAGRLRVVRQLLVESLILATLGGILAVFFAWISSPWMAAQLELNDDVPLSLPVLGFTGVLSLATGTFFGLVPAWTASDISLGEWLKGSGLGVRQRAWGARGALVAVQAALCIPALVAAGLLLQTLHNLYSVQTGLQIEQIVQADVDPRSNGYDIQRSMGVLQELQQRLAARPEVQAAAFASASAFSGLTRGRNLVRDDSGEQISRSPGVKYSWVSEDYFQTLEIPLISGRTFSASDTKDSPRVAIVNQTLARLVSEDARAVGRRVRQSASRLDALMIVGVVADSVQDNLRGEIAPFLYLPVSQAPISGATIYVRSAGSSQGIAKLLYSELAAVDPDLPLTNPRPMAESVARSVQAERRLAATLSTFGVIGLAIAAIGLYGVLSYTVLQRVREIGLRKALGARVADITGMVLRRAFAWVAVGATAGGCIAWMTRKLIEATLFGVEPTDSATYLGSGALLLAVAGLAALLAARRAALIEPMEALRHD